MIDDKMLEELGFSKADDSYLRHDEQIPSLEYRVKLSDGNDKIYISAWTPVMCDPDIIDHVIRKLNADQIHYVYSHSGNYVIAQNTYCIEPKSRDLIFNLISRLLTEIGSALECTVSLIMEIAYDAI